MPTATRRLLAVLLLPLAALAGAQSLRVEPLPLDVTLSGKVQGWQLRDGRLVLRIGDKPLQLDPVPFGSGATLDGWQATAQRSAHPAGPETRLVFRKGKQQLLLQGGIHPGSGVLPGLTLAWRDDRPLLVRGDGGYLLLDPAGPVAVEAAGRYCVRVLDLRVPASRASDDEIAADLLLWRDPGKACATPL